MSSSGADAAGLRHTVAVPSRSGDVSGAPSMRLLITAEHTSARFGGEAALALHYFRVLRQRGAQVWLVTHSRTRDELSTLFPDEQRIHYIPDSWLHRWAWHIGSVLPDQISYFTTGFVARLATQLVQRRVIRRLVASEQIDIIHQPMPVSPREPSMIFGFGVPVVIGPMNGGMDYPPVFRKRRGSVERVLLGLGRWGAQMMNRLMPGKRQAAMLVVANARTEAALPKGLCPRVVHVVENGVDLGLWRPSGEPSVAPANEAAATFVFLGRLVGWKAVELLVHAFKKARAQAPMRLIIIGDGDERVRLEGIARSLEVLAESDAPAGTIRFMGWMAQRDCAAELQRADCLVLPSLLECGGAVVLEAMSLGKPVIATAWGGPLDYLDSQCGVLVPPTDRDTLIDGFADAMIRLAKSPAERERLGRNGREKVLREYDWDVKVDRIVELYERAMQGHSLGIDATGVEGETSR